jgi:nitroreductase
MIIQEVLRKRKSVRSFLPRPVSPEDLLALFEAARWAPSNGNRQPWRFIARSSPEARVAMASCLSRGNQWALKAPVLITLVTNPAEAGSSNGIPYAFYDCGLAAMCLTVEAESRGLRVHQMAGWIRDPLVATLKLPAGVEPIAVMAVGYEGEVTDLEPALQEKEARPRTRKPLADVWTTDVWDQSWGMPARVEAPPT